MVPERIDAPRLRRLIQRPAGEPAAVLEQCELCAEPVPSAHRHLLDTSTRALQCVCRACALLFDRPAAGGDHYRLVPDRLWYVVDFAMDDPAWAGLNIPVDMAFFFHSSTADRVVAYYPSPAGPTESLLGLAAWQEIATANPVLAEMEPDVEALLVNRVRGARDHWLAPIDDCYALVGLIRTRWKGLSGGQEVWTEIDRFFAELRRRARTAHRDGADRHGKDHDKDHDKDHGKERREATWRGEQESRSGART